MKNIVVMGGGTGTYTVLTGIKHIPDVQITAIVSSADSGGSTGILRDQFGLLPVGDFRQCLVALSRDQNGDSILRELFQYRFSKGGDGLAGHNFGNLFLTALTDIVGNEEEAFRYASKILNIQGAVYPVTYDDVQLVAEYADSSIQYGESEIDEPRDGSNGAHRITKLWTYPRGTMSVEAKWAVEAADMIILGPGDLYTSTLACVVVDDVAKMISKSSAKLVYVTNLVSKWGQTHGFAVSDYVNEIERYCKRPIDHIILTHASAPKHVLDAYAKERTFPIEDDMQKDMRVIRGDFMQKQIVQRASSDKVKRSLLRHDSAKLAKVIEKLIR